MRLRHLLIASIVAVLALGAFSAGAEGEFAPEEWAGGNGWCQDGVCFRAWPNADGVELRWRAQGQGALRIVRLLPGSPAEPQVVAESDGSGEFSFFDSDLQRGLVYVYELFADDAPLGDPLEAGLATEATDPGGGTATYKVYVPLTIMG